MSAWKLALEEETITEAATPLFRDQIEEAIHPSGGTGIILGRW
jgi:hypothetical protein